TIVTLLVKNGADTVFTKTSEEDSLLHYAVSQDSLELIKILKSKGVDLKQPLKNDNNALMIAAGKGYEKITGYLLLQNFDLDKRNNHGNTALLMAAISNQAIIAKEIIEAGANPDLRNNKREQAITFAQKHKNTELITLLESASKKQGGILRLFK
ncbi:MAG: ankyrin repeat domain-containing protein, partial [Thiotrichaceae bacterium]|nr:ankyrin repeat domain-containing protein [Thiotrichaceae bacterium]